MCVGKILESLGGDEENNEVNHLLVSKQGMQEEYNPNVFPIPGPTNLACLFNNPDVFPSTVPSSKMSKLEE